MNNTTWYRTMMEQIDSLAEDLKLDEEQTNTWRKYILCVARDQYKEGNRAGAKWGLERASEIVSTTFAERAA